jgi:hypothetical protein
LLTENVTYNDILEICPNDVPLDLVIPENLKTSNLDQSRLSPHPRPDSEVKELIEWNIGGANVSYWPIASDREDKHPFAVYASENNLLYSRTALLIGHMFIRWGIDTVNETQGRKIKVRFVTETR